MKQKFTYLIWTGLCLFLLMLAQNVKAQYPKYLSQFPAITGAPAKAVNTLAQKGNTIYLGGNFTSLQSKPANGYGLVYNNYLAAVPNLAAVNPNSPAGNNSSPVGYATADGNGGWYIFGQNGPNSFTQVGGVARTGIARVNADGTLNTWNPNITNLGTGNYINKVTLVNGNLLVTGSFNNLNGTIYKYPFAMLDGTTGQQIPWWSSLSFPASLGTVKVLSVSVSNNLAYILGSYSGGLNVLETVDISDPNNPAVIGSISTDKNTYLVTNTGSYTIDVLDETPPQDGGNAPLNYTTAIATGGKLYLAGFGYDITWNNITYNNHTSEGQNIDTHFFSVDPATGKYVTSFNINTSSNAVLAAASDGNTVYFLLANPGQNSILKAFNATTGADITATQPALSSLVLPNGSNAELSVTADHKLFVTGVSNANGVSTTYALIDIATGTLQPNWSFPSLTVPGSSTTASLSGLAESNGKYFAYGNFVYAPTGTTYNGLTALNATTGQVLPWAPTDLTGTITASAVYNNTLYLGGNFKGPGGIKHLAAYDITDPNNPVLKTDWKPNPDTTVDVLLVNGTKLYAGGDFLKIGTQLQMRLAEFDVSSGSGTLNATWNPGPDKTVDAFAVLNSILYVGGAFNNIGTTPKNYVAAFDLNAGNSLTAWDSKILRNDGFNGTGFSAVSALAVQPADGANHAARVFIAGTFNSVGSGTPVNNIVAVNTSDGSPDAYQSTFSSGFVNQPAYSLAIDHNTLYCGSSNIFNSADISGNFAQVNATPLLTYNSAIGVKSIIAGNSLLFAGGNFTSSSDPFLQGFVAFQTADITPVITFANITKTYGDAAFIPAATSTVSTTPITYSIAAGDNPDNVISIAGDGTVTILKPGTAMITASQSGAVDVKAKITIAKKVLTVAANDATKLFSDPNPGFTTTITGWVGSDATATPSLINGAPAVKVSDPANGGVDPGATPAVGSYDLLVDTTAMTSVYYNFAITAGNFTVTKAQQTITATGFPATPIYGDAPAPLTVSSTSTSDLTLSSSAPTVATVTKDATGQYLLNAIGAGSTTITFSQAADANHDAGTVTQNITIAKKQLTSVVVDDKSILTGQTLPDFSATIKLFVPGDTTATAITPAPVFSTTAANTNAAGTFDINIDNYSSLTSANYILPATYTKGTLTIGSLSFNNIAKIYGDAPFNPGATSTQSGTITYSISNTNIATFDAGTGLVTITGVGTTNITATLSGSSVTRSFTVSPKQVTVSADNATKNYGDANPTFVIHYNGFANGENETNITPFTPATAVTTAIQGSNAGNYNITLSGASAANYTFAYTAGALLTVNKAPLTISADNLTKVYGQANPALTITYTGFVNGDDQSKLTTQAVASTTATTASGAGSYPITLTNAVAANYAITQNNGTLTITPASLTVTADNFTRDRGKPNPTFTITYSGFANGDNAASLATPATATSAAVPTSPQGTYPIIPAGAVSNNYTFNYVNGVLTVNGNQLLTYNPFSVMTYGDVDFNPGAVSDQGGTPTYTTSNPSVATIIGGNVHITGAGTADIMATFPAAGGYSISTDVQTLTVQKKNLTIQADNKTKNFGDPIPAFTFTYTGFVNNDSGTTPGAFTTPPVAATTATATSPVGSYPITVSGAASNNYNITQLPGTLTVSNLTRVLTFNAIQAKTYGDGDFSPANLNSGEQPLYTSSNPTVATIVNGIIHIIGAGTSDITASAPVNSNYNTVNPTTQTLTVNKAPLTITADNLSKTQGPPDITLTASYSGFVNNDNQLNLTTRPTLTTTAQTNSPTGFYPITVSGASSQNYTITYVNGTLTIIFGVGQDQIVVHPMLSPNGDGKNDFMLIDGIQNYPDNHVLVVNRNGAKVYEAHGYDNSSIVFAGKNSDGNALVAGTYYYEVSYTLKGNTQRKAGFIIIKY